MSLQSTNRRWFAWLALLSIIAGGVRAVHLLEVRDSPRWQVLIGDAARYHAWATEIAVGDWLGAGTFYQAPLYPYWLGAVYSLCGPNPIVARWVQAGIGVLSCLLLACAGGRIFGRRAGWIAGLLLAMWPAELFHESLLEKSSLTTLLMCALLFTITNALRRPRQWGLWLSVGWTSGLLCLLRENALILPVLWLAWIARLPRASTGPNGLSRRGRTAAAMLLLVGVAIPLSPVLVRNRLIGGDWRLTTAQFGPNFYIGNSREADGTYQELVPEHGTPQHEQADATAIAEQSAGRKLSAGEVSGWWTRRTWDDIRNSPARWLRLTVQKLALTWTNVELADSEDQYTAADESFVLRALTRLLPFWLLVGGAVAGLWCVRQYLHRLWILPAWLAVYSLSVAAFYLFARYRLPLLPILALLASAGCVRVAHAVRHLAQRRMQLRLISGGLAGVAAALLTLPQAMRPLFPDWPDLSIHRMRAVTEYNLAMRLWEKDAPPVAVEPHFAAATDLYPEYAGAWLYWGYWLQDRGQQVAAVEKFQRALEFDPDGADIRIACGETLLRLQRAHEALPHLSRAVELDSEDPVARQLLGRARYLTNDLTGAESALAAAVRLDAEYITARRLLAITLDRLHRAADAEREFTVLLSQLPADHPETDFIKRRLARRTSPLRKP